MGRPKATLPFGPELMLQRVIRLLSEVTGPCVVVAAADQPLPDLPSDVRIAIDERPGRGPLEGLYAGLRALPANVSAAYVTGCDVPLLVRDFVERMTQLLEQYEIAVPIEGKFHHPLAAVYRCHVAGEIKTLLDEDRLRPLFLFDQVNTRRVPVDELRDVDPQLDSLVNLNRPDDYEAALRRAGYRS